MRSATNNLSFWEHQQWFSNIDFAIIGSGIVGLSCALNLKARYPKSKVVILERGVLPNGASTKNAGFACFGSVSEILHDVKKMDQDSVCQLVEKRYQGLKLLRKTLGDDVIDYASTGGYELFTTEHVQKYEECLSKLNEVNTLLKPIFGKEVYSIRKNHFDFKNIQENLIYNQFEGQLNTGKLMQALIKKASSLGVTILNGINVTNFERQHDKVLIHSDNGQTFEVHKLFIATNGFANQLIQESVVPARSQVLVTNEIQHLPFKGIFHLDEGYFYFRNIGNRILLGGGRNLDFEGEETTEMAITALIQDNLEYLLSHVILPDQKVEVEYRWSGIMGVGKEKKAIVKQLSDNVYCGVRLGGMGVAIGSLIGKEMVELLS
jgi:gamma-glutamylputrescine oxidase